MVLLSLIHPIIVTYTIETSCSVGVNSSDYCYMYNVSTRTVPLVWETSGSVVIDSSDYCYIYDISTRTVPLVWETSGSVVVDSSDYCYMYDESTRTVPLAWETSVSVVVDSAFIVTCTMYQREQYHLFGKLVVLLSNINRILLHVRCIDKNSTTCLGNLWFCCR